MSENDAVNKKLLSLGPNFAKLSVLKSSETSLNKATPFTGVQNPNSLPSTLLVDSVSKFVVEKRFYQNSQQSTSIPTALKTSINDFKVQQLKTKEKISSTPDNKLSSASALKISQKLITKTSSLKSDFPNTSAKNYNNADSHSSPFTPFMLTDSESTFTELVLIKLADNDSTKIPELDFFQQEDNIADNIVSTTNKKTDKNIDKNKRRGIIQIDDPLRQTGPILPELRLKPQRANKIIYDASEK